MRAKIKMGPCGQALPGSRRAFALVLSLGMMSLLLLLMVSLGALTRLELDVASAHQVKARAEANARFALQQALGELQRTAGPDRRQSARADILGEDVCPEGNRYWTGIWNADTPLASPEWLVSGVAPDPRQLPVDGVTLVAGHTPAGLPAVTAEKVALDMGDGWEHRFAWWIGDEGVKASLQPGRALPEGIDDITAAATRNQIPPGCDIERFFRDELVADPLIAGGLSRLRSLRELPLLRTSYGAQLITEDEVRTWCHDYTACAYGVLENADTGGLKRNLSDPAFRDGDLINDAMRTFLTPSTEYRLAGTSAEADEIRPGETSYALYPIPTEITLKMRIFHANADAELKVRYHVEVEFWNPYSVPIAFPEDKNDEGYSRGMAVYFDNMPEVKIDDRDSDAPTKEDDLSDIKYYQNFDVYDYGGVLKQPYLCAWIDIAPDAGSEDAPVLQPGEVYRVMSPDPATQPEGLARSLDYFDYTPSSRKPRPDDVPLWADKYDSRPEVDSRIRVSIDHPNGKGVDVHFVPFTGENEDYRENDPYFSVLDLAYPNFHYEQRFGGYATGDPVYNLPFSLGSSLAYEHRDATIVYHWKLNSDAHALEQLSQFLSGLDLASPVFDAGAEQTGLDVDEIMELSVTYPRKNDRGMSEYEVFEDDELFHDSKAREHDTENLAPVLFDLPLTEPVSVGVMRYAQISGTPILALGNPRAEFANRVFDQYFFSPYFRPAGQAKADLLNPRLAPLNRAEYWAAAGAAPREDDAARLTQLGAFNLNSTSAEAWLRMLGSSEGEWEPYDETTMPRASVGLSDDNTFVRQPFRAAYYVSQMSDPDDIAEPRYAFTESGRTLSSREGDKQLAYLSEGIVSRLQARGRPFASVREFINAGIIQNAIADVGVLPGMDDVAPINEGLFPFSNVTLTQGDIMARLAPVANVRSDTFLIRTYGEATNPVTGEYSRAWCEATVRRLPGRLDGGDPMLPTAPGSLGRAFEVIDFRWLEPRELEALESAVVLVSEF